MVWSAFTRGGWNPWLELSRLQSELDRLFASQRAPADEFPPIEVWSGEAGLRLFAELPGFEPGDLEISVVGDTLTLKGSRAAEEHDESVWHRRERGSGQFVRTLQLPFAIETDSVEANYRNGTLEIDLPRAASERPRRIAVESA